MSKRQVQAQMARAPAQGEQAAKILPGMSAQMITFWQCSPHRRFAVAQPSDVVRIFHQTARCCEVEKRSWGAHILGLRLPTFACRRRTSSFCESGFQLKLKAFLQVFGCDIANQKRYMFEVRSVVLEGPFDHSPYQRFFSGSIRCESNGLNWSRFNTPVSQASAA